MSNNVLPKVTRFGAVFSESSEKISISVVIPMFKVEAYLGRMLESLENQQPGEYELELLFIDDGSPDKCAALVEEWMQRTKASGLLLEKNNAGVSRARNDGIQLATGDWIIFPDPDDFLSEDFFRNAAKFLNGNLHEDLNIISNKVVRYWDLDDSVRDTHALRFKFEDGARVVNLRTQPHFIQLQVASALIRLSHLRKNNIQFLPALHASEDSIFVTDALLASVEPRIGINPDSTYFYRKRSTADSAVDTFSANSATYLDRFENGYLRIAKQLQAEGKEIPEWFMALVIYELKWLFEAETSVPTKESVLGVEGRRYFLEIVSSMLRFVSDDAIKGYLVTNLNWEVRSLFLALKSSESFRSAVYLTEKNYDQSLVQLKYWFSGELPEEGYFLDGSPTPVVHSKVRTLDYFGQKVLKQRIVWVSSEGRLTVKLADIPQTIEVGNPRILQMSRNLIELGNGFAKSSPETIAKGKESALEKHGLLKHLRRGLGAWRSEAFASQLLRRASQEKLRSANGRRLAQIRRVAWSSDSQRKYGNAWVLSDRLLQAQDNAEHMYRWLRENRPEINTWYVLKRECTDWTRLENDGFKLVEFGSLEHYKLMLNADHHISSHADYEMFEPIPRRFYINGVRTWKYTFLQHGVTKDDVSLWLNSKKFDLFLTSTEPEQLSIVSDDTNYVFTSKEVKKTGMPRFDALLKKSAAAEKDTLLLIPTWRSYVLKPKQNLTGFREVRDDFTETQYFRNWQSLLADSRLREFASRNNLRIAFLPHPGIPMMVDYLDLPAEIEVLSYSDGDVQDLFARTHIAVTDFSSVVFDLAYAGARIAYFQFDPEQVHGAGHIMRQGYFSYHANGLGPVASDVDSMFTALETVEEHLPEEYSQRLEDLKWDRDGRVCERVYEAISALTDTSEG